MQKLKGLLKTKVLGLAATIVKRYISKKANEYLGNGTNEPSVAEPQVTRDEAFFKFPIEHRDFLIAALDIFTTFLDEKGYKKIRIFDRDTNTYTYVDMYIRHKKAK